MNNIYKHIFIFSLALAAAPLFSASAQTSTPSTVSSNQLCPTGGYTCTIEARSATSTKQGFTRDLTIGSRGSDVLELQQFLNQQGFFFGPFFGYFGPVTQKALIEYQKMSGITPAWGYFGPKTRTHVNIAKNLVPAF